MTASRSRRRVVSGRVWPRVDYYEALRSQTEETHPIDVIVDHAPSVRKTYRQVLALERKIHVPDAARFAFVRYCDARLLLQSLRENMAFNVGVEIGTIVGRQGALHAKRGSGAADDGAFRFAARGLMLEGPTSPRRRLLTFLEMAWALASGPADVTTVAAATRRTAAASRGQRR